MTEKTQKAQEEVEEKCLADLQPETTTEEIIEENVVMDSYEEMLEVEDAVDDEEQKAFEKSMKEKIEAEEKALEAAQLKFGLQDSGTRQTFETGAQRDAAEDKPRIDLIHPYFLKRFGEHMRRGAAKYDSWNWAKGIPTHRSYASLMRHAVDLAEGEDSEDHLAAIAANVMFIMCTEELVRRGLLPPELLTMPDWRKK